MTEGVGNPDRRAKNNTIIISITITIGVGGPRIPTARCTTIINTHEHRDHNTFAHALDWTFTFGAIVAQVFSSS